MNAAHKFNSEQELKKHIGDNIDMYKDLLKEKVGPFEEEYIKNYKRGLVGLFLVVASIVPWFVHPPLFIPLSIFLLYFGVRKIRNALPVMYRYNKALDRALYVLVFELFDIEANYLEQPKEAEPKELDLLPKKLDFIKYIFPKKFFNNTQSPAFTEKIRRFLDNSELMVDPKNTLLIDDMFTVKLSDKEMLIAELDAKDIQRGRRRFFIKPIFSGLFVTLELPHVLDGKTFISTEVDLLYQDLTTQSFDPDALETKLEWNDFEKLLQVKTTNPVEARYILTPDFMEDLYNWWRHKKQQGDKRLQVRLSFLGNRMYLLFPDKRVRIGNQAVRIHTDSLRENLESIAIPLMHIFNLTSDVEKRFTH